jgi:heterodisulfide reductase subunit A-like polyferredoxin
MRRIGVFVCHCGINIAQNVEWGRGRKGIQIHVF